MANSLETPAELTLEEQKKQLEQRAMQLNDEKAQLLFDGLKPTDVIMMAKQEEINKNLNALEKLEPSLEGAESVTVKFPNVAPAEAFLKKNTEQADEKLKSIEADIAKLQENFQNLNNELLESQSNLEKDKMSLDLKIDLLKKQRQLEKTKEDILTKQKLAKNIRAGLELHKERDENLEKAA